MKKYKVLLLQDNTYQVFGWNESCYISYNCTGIARGDFDYNTVLFQGTLPECEAWIRLTEEGYL